MRKTNLIKIISVLLITLLIGMYATSVYAEGEGEDIYDSLEGSMDNSSETTKPEEKPAETTKPEEKPAADKNKENTSIYNNETKKDTTNATKENLPNTGLEDNLPMVAVIAVAGVAAVFTYKKVKEYSNI